MFHFPAFPPHGLYIQPRVTPHNMVPGFPIRKSWPQRPVIDSTRLIADSHVLHRLLMPRHPPCALKNFNTKQSSQKLSYKTINKITTNKTQTPHTPRTGAHGSSCLQDARVHYTVPKQQPHTPTPHTHTRGTRAKDTGKQTWAFNRNTKNTTPTTTAGTACLLPQNPTVRHNPVPQAPPPAFQPQAPTTETHGVLTSSTTHSTKPGHNPHTQQCTDHDR